MRVAVCPAPSRKLATRPGRNGSSSSSFWAGVGAALPPRQDRASTASQAKERDGGRVGWGIGIPSRPEAWGGVDQGGKNQAITHGAHCPGGTAPFRREPQASAGTMLVGQAAVLVPGASGQARLLV